MPWWCLYELSSCTVKNNENENFVNLKRIYSEICYRYMASNGSSTHRTEHIVTIVSQSVAIDSSFVPQLSLLQDEFAM